MFRNWGTSILVIFMTQLGKMMPQETQQLKKVNLINAPFLYIYQYFLFEMSIYGFVFAMLTVIFNIPR